ncbi:MAG: hypothetical protein AAFR47_04360 [Pseudomonadota bacterium]
MRPITQEGKSADHPDRAGLKGGTAAVLAISLALQIGGCPAYAQSTTALTREVPLSAEAGGPRRWQVASHGANLRAAPSHDAPTRARIEGGRLLSNLGCQVAETTIWCTVRPIHGGARGFLPKDALTPAPGPDGTVPTGPNDSADRVRKGDYDARGRIACAQEQGEAMGSCSVGVARSGGGDATAIVTFGNGFSRVLSFVQGDFTRANTTMSGNGTDTDWRKEGDLHLIRVDDQRYEIPDTLIFGG